GPASFYEQASGYARGRKRSAAASYAADIPAGRVTEYIGVGPASAGAAGDPRRFGRRIDRRFVCASARGHRTIAGWICGGGPDLVHGGLFRRGDGARQSLADGGPVEGGPRMAVAWSRGAFAGGFGELFAGHGRADRVG